MTSRPATATRGVVCGAATLIATAVVLLWLGAAAAGALSLSPSSGTPDASPTTQISFLGTSPDAIRGVVVVGSRSGLHHGRLRRYASAAGASFLPDHPFVQGESVRVTALVGTRPHQRRVGTNFTIARLAGFGPATMGSGNRPPPPVPAGAVQRFLSVPGLQPPSVQVLLDSPQASTGQVLLAPAHGPGQHGAMIIDGAGRLVWFQQASRGKVAMDLQVARYRDQPVLTWWEGRIVGLGVGLGTDQIYDSRYQQLARIAAGNGYEADLHELQITPAGAAFITAYSPVRADLSSGGGSRQGVALDSIVQEVDIATGLVMFEWHALGHVPLFDSYTHPSPGLPWDYFHVNSISLDPWGDGNFIISSRNTWAAYELSARTGAILWRIGGRRPTFAMGSGTGMAWQHDVRWQPDHSLTIFDDGALPQVHSQSRVIRERIDWKRRRVVLVGRYAHTPAIVAGSQGDYQVLSDGNSFVGWGEAPYITEFGAGGQQLFDARLPPGGQTYRAFRASWRGQPSTPPAIAVASSAGRAVAYVSWNGATEVRSWRVLGGERPDAGEPVGSGPRTGFETPIPVSGVHAWYAAEALGDDGQILGISAAVQP